MSKLSWNEIRQNAIRFSKKWADAKSENAEAQTFWNEFFQVFGLERRTYAAFEEPVKSIRSTYHRIDLFWRGRLLVEHKSAGEPLDKATSQAFEYIRDLADAGRYEEIPRYIVVSDFRTFVLHDLEPEEQGELFAGYEIATRQFALDTLNAHAKHFAFLIGQQVHRFGEEDPANITAAEIMAKLHGAVEESGYPQRDLEQLLVRLLFCLFAEDTGIFEVGQFELYLINHTKEDGSDLGQHLSSLFEILNTAEDRRSKHLEEDLNAFPYINGELFADHISLAGFNRDMRSRLLAACRFNWSKISPAIFGSLFQGIMDPKGRRQGGGHYTSERDILKVIRPLFLDDLREELVQIRNDKSTRRRARLDDFRSKLTRLKFLDPACGCGNFLVVAYRELRRLELEALKIAYNLETTEQQFSGGELASLARVDVDQFYGIEIGEWPARIAETALWLTDHQMNNELSIAFGNIFQRIPLRAAPHIRCDNALRCDWDALLPADQCSFVLGNPPFVGAKLQLAAQRADVARVAGHVKNHGLLDYVTMWYFVSAEYIRANPKIRGAFVSTNSVSQGEQVGVLWTELYRQGLQIHFAHRTFCWQSEAKGKAHVHVVIIGFGLHDVPTKQIFEYHDLKGEPSVIQVDNINPYLVRGSNLTIQNRSTPLCRVPKLGIGNKPIDGGNYFFTPEQKRRFLSVEPAAAQYFRRWIGARELLNGHERWYLWLGECPPHVLRNLPQCRERVDAVRQYRDSSDSTPTKKLAATPTRFHVEFLPDSDALVIPRHSSETRKYIPFGYFGNDYLIGDACLAMPDANLFIFGVLTSSIHMAWVRLICGRIKSDFRYSAKLVYNNFPWPEAPTKAQKAKVESLAQAVLDARLRFLDTGSSLADIYDPLTMPGDLLKAHQKLDRAVDFCYRSKKFGSDRERVEFLFDLYERLTQPLALTPKPKMPRQRRARRKATRQ